MPRVSVVIPTYNRREMVREAVTSALAQTLDDIEIIVVDDGSTDGTAEALTAEFGDRIRVEVQSNQGESVARNRGIELARAEYVAFLDSDDMWLPEKLAAQIEILENKPEFVLTTTSFALIDRRGRPISTAKSAGPPNASTFSAELTSIGLESPITSGPSTVLVRRSALLEIGGFDASIRYGEDFDAWLRLRLLGDFGISDVPLVRIRVHGESQFNSSSSDASDERLESYIHITNRFFDLWPEEPPVGLRERCIARRYLDIALMDYVGGRAQSGQQRFAHAIDLAPELSQRGINMFEQRFGWEMRRRVEFLGRGLSSTEAVFDEAMRQWPDALEPIPYGVRKWMIEEIFGTLGWRYARDGDWVSARRCLARQARVDRSVAFNRGFWSVCLRSLIASRSTLS